MKVVGFNQFSFKDKDTNALIEGFSIHCLDEFEADKGVGSRTHKFSLKPQRVKELPVKLPDLIGKNVTPVYNQYGKVDTIVLLG